MGMKVKRLRKHRAAEKNKQSLLSSGCRISNCISIAGAFLAAVLAKRDGGRISDSRTSEQDDDEEENIHKHESKVHPTRVGLQRTNEQSLLSSDGLISGCSSTVGTFTAAELGKRGRERIFDSLTSEQHDNNDEEGNARQRNLQAK